MQKQEYQCFNSALIIPNLILWLILLLFLLYFVAQSNADYDLFVPTRPVLGTQQALIDEIQSEITIK